MRSLFATVPRVHFNGPVNAKLPRSNRGRSEPREAVFTLRPRRGGSSSVLYGEMKCCSSPLAVTWIPLVWPLLTAVQVNGMHSHPSQDWGIFFSSIDLKS